MAADIEGQVEGTVPDWKPALTIVAGCLIFGAVVAGFMHWAGWL